MIISLSIAYGQSCGHACIHARSRSFMGNNIDHFENPFNAILERIFLLASNQHFLNRTELVICV